MPRMQTDELVGYAFEVQQGERQVVDNGTPVFNGTGQPKMQPMWIVVLTGRNPAGDVHRIVVGFDRGGKDKLVQALTGVQPVSGLDLPLGVEL